MMNLRTIVTYLHADKNVLDYPNVCHCLFNPYNITNANIFNNAFININIYSHSYL